MRLALYSSVAEGSAPNLLALQDEALSALPTVLVCPLTRIFHTVFSFFFFISFSFFLPATGEGEGDEEGDEEGDTLRGAYAEV